MEFLFKWRPYIVPVVTLESNSSKNETESNDIDKPVDMPGKHDCCQEGCKNCVWLNYVIDVKYRVKNNREEIQKILDRIPCSDVRFFVEMELKKED
ncbi:oxidoreductase-like domain-containing protein [Nephila pilipes]|uniref:Oxidoreductase-like domain-containing protein n=1 Tax=Nephila pilipes TaxID=299642 RepID=A0A8X6UAF7_NEPPI|nr:oxidoreductase-like domain-containing protein [Nephila pilipes]